MQRTFPLLRFDRPGDVRVAIQIPGRIEINRCPQFGFRRFDTVQVVLENAGLADRGDVGGVEMRQIDGGVEQQVADTIFLDAMAEVMIVAIEDAEFGKNLVRQVRIAVTIGQLIEQPVRRTIQGAAPAIGIEGRPPVPSRHPFGDLRIHLPMPLLIEHAIGRMALLLPNLQVVFENRRRFVVADDRRRPRGRCADTTANRRPPRG